MEQQLESGDLSPQAILMLLNGALIPSIFCPRSEARIQARR